MGSEAECNVQEHKETVALGFVPMEQRSPRTHLANECLILTDSELGRHLMSSCWLTYTKNEIVLAKTPFLDETFLPIKIGRDSIW
jgi:hypothetical protein